MAGSLFIIGADRRKVATDRRGEPGGSLREKPDFEFLWLILKAKFAKWHVANCFPG